MDVPIFDKNDVAGVPSQRLFQANKLFEGILDQTLGEQVRADGALAADLWSALSHVVWHGPDGQTVHYSFRKAAEVVAWVREDGDDLAWYCISEPAVVAPWISEALAAKGWSWSLR